MIVFSDLHLRPESEGVVFDEVLPGIYDAAMKDDQHVAFLGDWWHIRYNVPVRLFNRVRDTLTKWSKSGFTTYLLPGNHDQINYEGRNALEAYGDIENVEVFNEPTTNKWGMWIPYRKRNEDIVKAMSLHDEENPAVLWMHHGVRGALMNDHYANGEGLELSAFFNFAAVFCGHYHKRQVLQHVTYIGSPWQTKADESGQAKGYGVWDGNNMLFVDTNWGKRYHRIELAPGMKLDLSQVRSKDEVRVTTLPGVDADAIGKQLSDAGIANVVTPVVEEMEARLDVAPESGLSVYAEAFVEATAGDLDKSRLMGLFGEVSA